MQFEGRKADLAMFKERAEALHRAVAILEEGIAASRAQVQSQCMHIGCVASPDYGLVLDWQDVVSTVSAVNSQNCHSSTGLQAAI